MSIGAGTEGPWKSPSSRESLTFKQLLKFQLYDTQKGGDSSVNEQIHKSLTLL